MVTVSDDFDRADNASLGASWTEVVGDWTIASNQAECNDDDGATGYYARFETDVGSADMYAEVVTNSTQTDGSSNTGPAVRMRAAANTSYQFPTNLNDSCSFWRINAGAETQIATFTTAIAVGDTVRLEACGRTFRFKVNGALRNLVQDTNITDGERGGLNGYNNVGSDVVRIDNFAAGPLTDLLAPYVADWSAQTARTTGTPSTPTIPAQVTAGDLVVVPATVRATTSNITAPAGEGWSEVQLASGNSLRMYAFAKIWGLGGQTDDTTPSFAKDAGAVGFFTHALIFRNPAHATAPWTSVASAIVASDQQSNAAAATATAPSVTHDGTHRTIVRLFSSADDNALNAPSEGVLVTGGAAYDATDIAQACSVIEDVTVTTSTGTATVTESVNGNDANNGITLVVAIPSSATNANAANATGSGTANQPSTHVQPNTGLASGAGSAPAATARVAPNAGAATASGSAFPAGTSGTTSAGNAAGTGSALQASALVAPLAGVAAGSGQANPATIATAVTPTAGSPEGTGSANGASVAVAATAGVASGTGSAWAPAVFVAVHAGVASASGEAPQPTVQTGAFTNADAGVASATGTVSAPAAAIATQAGLAGALGLAGVPSTSVAPVAGVGLAGGSGLPATVLVHNEALAGAAVGAGAAEPARVLVDAGARTATASGSAFPATVDASTQFTDPNPTIVRIRDSGPSTLADRPIQRLREPA